MATPITWRNVTAPDFSGASRMIETARSSLNDAFKGADGLITDFQGIQQGNQEARVNNNTEQFLATLQKRYQDPEALRQAQASGEIDALRQQFGQYGLNTEKTGMEAVNTLVSGLQSRARSDQEYTDFQTKLANREMRDEHARRLANGDLEGARALEEEITFLNEGEMAQARQQASINLENQAWTREQRNNSRQDRAEIQQQKALNKQADALSAKMFARIQSGELNPTQGKNELFRTLMGVEGMTQTMAAEKVAAMDSADFLTSQLSKRDQAEIDQGLAKIDETLKQNEFYQWENSKETPAAATNRVLAKLADKIDDGWNQEEIHDFALMAMTDGYDLGTGTKQRLPPEAVEYILSHPDVGALWNGNPDDHVQRLILENPYWKDRLLENTQGKLDRKTYQAEYLKNTVGKAAREAKMSDRGRNEDAIGYFMAKIGSR